MDSYYSTAQLAAIEAGKILMDNFGQVDQADIRNKSAVDFLSYVDETSEKKIIEIIKSAFPDHAILAEEGGGQKSSSDYCWVIDPLDGTTNYLHSIPIFAVSIALEFKKKSLFGLVYDPMHNDIFHASKGKGAFLNTNKIHVSNKPKLEGAFIATGFPFKYKHHLKKYLNVFGNIFEHCIGKRRLGAAALDLAYVACGRFDGFWEIALQPWDMAAGKILIEEARGKISNFWNNTKFENSSYVMASNKKIHDALGNIIRDEFPVYQDIAEEYK